MAAPLTQKEKTRKNYLSRKLDRKGTLSTQEVVELRSLVQRTAPRGRPKVSESGVTNVTRLSATSNLQDGNEHTVNIPSTVTLTVNGQEVNVPVEVSIQFQVAASVVTQ